MKQIFCGQPVTGVPTTICMTHDGLPPAWTTLDYCAVLGACLLLAFAMWHGRKK